MATVSDYSHPCKVRVVMICTVLAALLEWSNGERAVMPPNSDAFIGVDKDKPDVCIAISRDLGQVKYESSKDYENSLYYKGYGYATGYGYGNPNEAHTTFIALRNEGNLKLPEYEELVACLNQSDRWKEVLISGMISISTTSPQDATKYISIAKRLGFRDEHEKIESRRPDLENYENDRSSSASSLHALPAVHVLSTWAIISYVFYL